MTEDSHGELRNRLHRSIPGGSHTYSKGDDQFPRNAPVALKRGRGAHVFDLSGRRFIDYGMGLRAVTLGYGRADIVRAATRGMRDGNNLTRPSFLELESAEKILSFLRWPEMVKFAKNGSNVTTAAVKLARAATGKNHVLIPDTQPFFSFDDWFIGKTPVQRGVLGATSAFTHHFRYGSIESVREAHMQLNRDVAAIILEPVTAESPCKIHADISSFTNVGPCTKDECQSSNFLYQLREFCSKNNIVLVFDEMVSGLRWADGGGSEYFGVQPDLSTFGKALGNGFSVSCLVGSKAIMELGSINQPGAERTFLLSSTNGAEMGPLGAMLQVLKIYEEEDVVGALWEIGEALKGTVLEAISSAGASDFASVTGSGANFGLSFHPAEKELSNAYRTFFLGSMTEKGVLIPWIAPSVRHNSRIIETTGHAIAETLRAMSRLVDHPETASDFGPPVRGVFRKYN